jgi:PAS domain S-box-containing protein
MSAVRQPAEWVELMKNSDQSYREIFDGVNDMILVHDLETGEILDANRKCLEAGYTVEEIKRMGVAGFSPPGERYAPERISRLIRRAAEGEPQLFEWGFRDREGRIHPTEVSLRRALIQGKNRLIAIVRDISERKEAERELQQARDSFHSIVEKSSDGILVLDMRETVVFANEAAAAYLGCAVEDMLGGPFTRSVRGDDDRDIRITRENGEPGVGDIRRSRTVWQGAEGWLVTIRDVTERQRLLAERQVYIDELTEALRRIQTLKGLLPICSCCKKIRNDAGYWEQIETYITQHSEAEFTHSVCPECAEKYFREYQGMQAPSPPREDGPAPGPGPDPAL